ncbi:MAG: hypothetical protein HC881_10090 [Leptolyngbyaceae cyanobacterium SL_7_1]|nr:hypothetical protein [Leptolyngbyaceae cyanobacterium SL_7_1]
MNEDTANADATWNQLLEQYPDHPLVAEALYQLGEEGSPQWEQVWQQFPAHPRSVQIAQMRLQEDPQQLPMLLLLAQHGRYVPEIETVLNRLTTEYASQLQPQDWETIAFAYWELGQYGNAGFAYAKAPPTSLNMYRAGRGAQLGDRTEDAIAAYKQMIQTHADGEETSLALLRLARLEQPEAAKAYADQIIERFPTEAGAALLERSKILDALNSPQSASQARQSVLNQYSQSDAAAELRWQLAEQRAAAGDITGAWEMARQIAEENLTSELAQKLPLVGNGRCSSIGLRMPKLPLSTCSPTIPSPTMRGDRRFIWVGMWAILPMSVKRHQNCSSLRFVHCLRLALRQCKNSTNWDRIQMPGVCGKWNLPILANQLWQSSSPMG